MKFSKIVLVDKTGLRNWAISELQKYSIEQIDIYQDYPNSDSELVKRIGKADCIFVSWNTQISENVMKKCTSLKYVGMCCSLYNESSANVDIKYAKSNGIEVRGVRDYGDEGLIEFIISELIRLMKGLGENRWKDEPVELTNRKLGIIGMGTTGQMLADRARAFQMEVYYYNRSRKPKVEDNGIKYMSLEDLLSTCEIISTHLPKNTKLLDDKCFEILGSGKILINTSLGLTFEKSSFLKWIKGSDNYAIFDGDGIGRNYEEFKKYNEIVVSQKVGGWTSEAIDRLSKKVLENIKDYIENEHGSQQSV
jgi:lactate dehydrogenase-like 2-hydroxyacid dehydrogenase